MKRPAAFIVVAILAVALALTGCGKVKPGVAEVKRPEVAGVTVATASKARADDYYETAGTIKARSVSTLASKVMGTVTAISVREGDRVEAGQVLITLNDSDLAARIAAAQAGHREALKAVEVARQNQALAGVTYQRYQQLYGDKAISQQEMDQVATQKRVSELSLEQAQESAGRAGAEAQALYGFTRIVAPTAGVVTGKRIDVGSMAVPGVPLITVEDVSAFSLETDVDESLAGLLAVGMAAEVRVDALGKSLKGTVTELAPAIDPAARKFHIKVEVAGEGLKSGLYAKIRLPVGAKDSLMLPRTAVVEKGQLTGVYVVGDKGVMTYRLVRLGKVYGDKVEILSGLSAGERVVVGGVDKAVDGGVLKEVVQQ